jgi:hypothetical protein
MRGLHLVPLLLALAPLGRTCSGQANGPSDPCRLTHIPLSMPPGLGLKVINHWLMFEPFVEGALYLRNDTGKPVSEIAILVTYEGQQGKPIFTIEYDAHVTGRDPRVTLFRPFLDNVLTRAVRPGEAFGLFGTSLLSTTTIPAKSEAALIVSPMAHA